MPETRKIFRRRLLYTPVLRTILGKTIKEIQVDKSAIMFRTRKSERRYPWSEIQGVEVESRTIKGGAPIAVVKRTLSIITPDKIYELDISWRRSQIENPLELVRELHKYTDVKEISRN